MNTASGLRSRILLANQEHDDTRVVSWELLMRLLTTDERDASASSTAIQLARLRAIRELYAAGDAAGALAIAALLEIELREPEDEVSVEIVGEDEVELMTAAEEAAEEVPPPDSSTIIVPSRILMAVPVGAR